MADVIIGNAAAGVSPTSVAASRLVPASEPTPQVSVSTASLPVLTALTTPTPVSQQNFTATLAQNIQPNPLNQYWQPSYHFKLFMAGDADLLSSTDATNITQLLGTTNSLNQVVIAESGVTGYNIREVEIATVVSQNGLTREQLVTTVTMVITEPMGISFLDALAGAGVLLGVKDYTKMTYFLQLTFTGYNPDGTFAGNPIPIGGGNSNGGRWLWGLIITNVDVKVNEGAAVYTLTCVITESAPLVIESESFTTKQTIIAQGNTLGDILNDYAAKFTLAFATDAGKDSKGKPLLTIKINATHPIDFGVTSGVTPASFAMAPQNKDVNNIRNAPLPGGYQLTAGAGMTVNEFIAMAIKNTAQGQAYIKNVNILNSTDPAPEKFRLSAFFSIETDIKVIDWDSVTGKYVKEVTLHIIPCYSQTSILSRQQQTDAQTPSVQRAMISDVAKRGLLRKEYDFLFTGLNTEVIDFNIDFNVPWQAELPKQEGARMNYLNVAINNKQNPTPQPTPPQLQPTQLATTPPANPAPQQAINTATPPTTPASMVGTPTNALTHTVAPASAKVLYMEDVLNSLNQGQTPTVLPVSFFTGYHDVERDAGANDIQSGSRDQPLAGAIISQKFYNYFAHIDITIRGDPYWLGQTNVERQVTLRTNGSVHDPSAPPNYSTGNPMFILKFLYPSQLGPDFRPILKNSLLFNGIYEVVGATHTFSEGAFRTKLAANKMILFDLNLANTADPASTQTSQNSPQNGNAVGGDSTTGTGSTPGAGTSSIAPSGGLPNSQTQQQLAQQSYNFWVANGYSPAGASAMVSQEEAESAFGTNPHTSTNPSVAAGNFQWSPTRQAQILAGTGIDVSTASHDQQLQAALWEQTQGGFRNVGSQLQTATDPGAAGVLATQKYEIPAALQTQSQIRGGRAAFWNSNFTGATPVANNGAPI